MTRATTLPGVKELVYHRLLLPAVELSVLTAAGFGPQMSSQMHRPIGT